MKKLLAIVLTAAMLLAMLCACSAKPTETAATDTKATIGILMPTKEQTIWSIQGERLTEAFQKAGYATQIEYAEDDSAKQAMQIENMITKGVNVLVIAAVDCAALTDACEKAKDAGIYVIADDRLITNTKAVFEPAELKTIVEAYKDVKVTPDSTSKSYLMLRVMGACDKNHANERFGASRSSLEAKLRYLDETQATALMVWASAYWVSRNCTATSLDEYIRKY